MPSFVKVNVPMLRPRHEDVRREWR